MKTSLFTSIGALAFAGLCITLAPSPVNAHDGRHERSHCVRSLPHGSRCVRYHGERCWAYNGNYYRCGLGGGYVLFSPTIELPVVEEPVVEVDAAVSFQPDDSEIVYIDGERCWFHGGCYYRHCEHGYKKVHCSGHEHIEHCSRHTVRSHHTRHS